MSASLTLVRMVGHAWMGFTVSPACVQVHTPAHFAKVRNFAYVTACRALLYFLLVVFSLLGFCQAYAS